MADTVLYGIRNCDTVKKARGFLDARGVAHRFHDFKVEGVEPSMLERWCQAAGWETVLNRAGTTFRRLPETDKADLTPEKAVALMLAQPSMIKRPVLERDGAVHVGFKPAQYEALFGA